MRDVIFAVADNGSDCKTLDIGCAFLAVAVGDIIDCTFVILLEDIDIKYVLAYKFLVGYRSDDIFPSRKKTITSSISEQLATNSSFFKLFR